jgi:hypothetical protein
VRPLIFVAISTTMASLLVAPELVWLIEHDCVMPVVLTHAPLFMASGASVACTTAQLAREQRKSFLPPAVATWTTG